jgi:hypothetical protein
MYIFTQVLIFLLDMYVPNFIPGYKKFLISMVIKVVCARGRFLPYILNPGMNILPKFVSSYLGKKNFIYLPMYVHRYVCYFKQCVPEVGFSLSILPRYEFFTSVCNFISVNKNLHPDMKKTF